VLPDALRVATPADNDALRELERACPRARSCASPRSATTTSSARGCTATTTPSWPWTLEGPHLRAIAASSKEVLIGGTPRKIVVFNDLRVHPDYRRTVLARHMLGAWLAMERWAKDVGAHAICGLVKADNDEMSALQGKKSEYRWWAG